jgi:hypothetical protein
MLGYSAFFLLKVPSAQHTTAFNPTLDSLKAPSVYQAASSEEEPNSQATDSKHNKKTTKESPFALLLIDDAIAAHKNRRRRRPFANRKGKHTARNQMVQRTQFFEATERKFRFLRV